MRKVKDNLKSVKSRAKRQGLQRDEWRARFNISKRPAPPVPSGRVQGNLVSPALRQLYYNLLAYGVSTQESNKVILSCLEAFDVDVTRLKLCCNATINEFRYESGCFARIRLAEILTDIAKTNGGKLNVVAGRDGTSHRGTSYQIETFHYEDVHGQRQSVVVDLPLTHGKTAEQQVATSLTVHEEFFALCGEVDIEVVGRVTDRAGNEQLSNRLEGVDKETWFEHYCGHHDANSTVKNSVHPKVKAATLVCQGNCPPKASKHPSNKAQGVWTKWIASQGGAKASPQGPPPTRPSMLQCRICEGWSHSNCLFGKDGVVPWTFSCRGCEAAFEVPAEWWGHAYWVEGQDMQRQLVKALYEKNYGLGFHGQFQQVVDLYNEQQTDHDKRVAGMNRHVGERFQGLSYCGATLLKDKECILIFLEGKQDNEWLRKLTTWFKSERCTVFLSICAILHTTFGKRSFEVTKQNMNIVSYKQYVDTMIWDLDKYTEDPRLTLESEGRGMCLVRALPDTTKVWLFLKLKPLMLRMTTMFKEYTKEFRGGKLDHTTYLPGHAMLDALRIAPATSCFEESGFAVLKRVLELGGVTLSPWKAAGTAIYKINKDKIGKMTLPHVHLVRALAKKKKYRNKLHCRGDLRQLATAYTALKAQREGAENAAKAAAKDKKAEEKAAEDATKADKKAEEKAAKDATKEAERLRKAADKPARPRKPYQKRKAPETPVETAPRRSIRKVNEQPAAEQEAVQAAKQAAEQADKQAAQQAADKYIADMEAAGVAWWLPLLPGHTCLRVES
jgi:hypothetical protein